MKANALSVVLSTLSLAGVGLLYVEVQDLSESVSLARSPADSRLDNRGAGVVEPRESGERSSYLDADGDATPSERNSGPRADRKTPAGRASFEERLDVLEEKFAKTKQPQGGMSLGNRLFSPRRYYTGTDHLARDLKLTTNQKDRVDAIFKRGRELIQDVLKIPDEEGKSPHERRQEAMKKMREQAKKNPSGMISLLGGMMGHRAKKIPGRNVTYGEEVDRIKKETRGDVNSVLDTEQQERFKDANVDSLTGGHGGAMTTSIFVAAGANMDRVTLEEDVELTEEGGKDE